MRTIFDVVANEWRPWFRKFKWLPSAQQVTWTPWFSFLRVLFGEKLSDADLELFRQCSGRSDTPSGGFTTAWLCCGRRSGKSRMLAMVAAYLAVFRDWRPYLSPGEVPTVMVIAQDRKQARTIFRYVREFLKALEDVSIERETQEVLELSNGVSVEIMTADFRSVRGYTAVALLLDELAFWSFEGSNPADEILKALQPSMLTVPGAMLLCASSPFAKKGVLYDAYGEHFGKDGADVLFWKSPTRTMNPSVPESYIAQAVKKDPASAAAEYGAEFRDDVTSFIPLSTIDDCIMKGCTEIPPVPGERYHCFVDVASGIAPGGDSMAMAIAHLEDLTDENDEPIGQDVAVIDYVAEVQPPFQTNLVAAQFAQAMGRYGLRDAVMDRVAYGWCGQRFNELGVRLTYAKTKTEIYLAALPLLGSGSIHLLDIPRLKSQILNLKRSVTGAGHETVDHPSGNHHDDIVNVVLGAAVTAHAAGNWQPYMVGA
jgi:Terminase large subunit, T4likevirus-type, N-terminal